MPRRMTIDEFIEIASKIHNNKYDYSLVEYKNNSTKVKIICPIHGVFKQTPSAHIHNRQGCSACRSMNMKKILLGVGVNDYCGSVKSGNRHIRSYTCWRNMIIRCYDKDVLSKYPSYRGCTVCDEWLHFSLFKQWFDENYIDGCELDKDVLSADCKIYSPDTCIFIPWYINNLIRNRKDGKYTMGVFYDKKAKKYIARVTFNGKLKYSTVFRTEEEAACEYRRMKTKLIHDVAKIAFMNGEINDKAYTALINFKVK